MAALPRPTPVDAGAARTAFAPSFKLLFAIFAAEFTAISLWRMPETLAFDSFAFCDQGANLTVQYLIGHGYRPGLDFGYHYGLLPLILAHGWFAAFGLTPQAYAGAMLACGLLFAWAMARILAVLRVGPLGMALSAITLGFAMQPAWPNAAHALEAVLLAHALAQQAQGSRSNALALTAVAAFVKPSMAYLYGPMLVLILARDLVRRRADAATWIRSLAPAAAAAIVCAIAVSAVFGISAAVHAIFPLQGAVAYRTLDYGFFAGSGRALWAAPGMPWSFYLIHIPGLWIAASVYLLGAAILAARHMLAGVRGSGEHAMREEMILTCAILHLAFVLLLFGNQWSWIYYFYLLVIGVALSADLGPWRRRGAAVLCLMGLLAWTATAHKVIRARETTSRYRDTGGLYAPRAEALEWRGVLDAVRGSHAIILDTKGAAELSFPEFDKPATLYLDRGLMQPAEVQRKLAQLSSANSVVVPLVGNTCGGVPDAPQFVSALAQFEPVRRGSFFELLRRR